jgi:hypothetical protein
MDIHLVGVVTSTCSVSTDGSMVMTTVNPCSVFVIFPDHRYCTEIDLFDYFSSQPGTIMVCSVKMPQEKVCIGVYSPTEHTLLLLDLDRNVISNYKVSWKLKRLLSHS